MKWLLAASASALVFCAVALGTYVPRESSAGVEYAFIAPHVSAVLFVGLPICVALAIAYGVVRRNSASQGPSRTDAVSGRWLAPIAALGVVAIGLIPAMPGLGERWAVVVYVFYDLRWWWLASLAALAAVQAEACLGAPVRTRLAQARALSTSTRLLALDAALFTVVVAWATVTSPTMRFDNGLHGDEPKYVRYCEAWYQGAGVDLTRLNTVATQSPAASPALFDDVGRVARVVPEIVHDMTRDVGDFLLAPSQFRWNRVRTGDGFIKGKHGGIYQVHAPGLSAVLMPGYVIDRYLLTTGPSPDGKFPSDIVMTNAMMLLVYGVAGVVLFRLLRNALGSDGLAWIWATAAMVTMPTTAFAFQLYPELPALLIVLGVSNHLWFSDLSRRLSAACAGAATGALIWLHPRFLLVALCLTVVAAARMQGRPRRTYLLASGAVLLSVMAFNYHVTGSWLPTAIWNATGRGVNPEVDYFFLNLIAYGFDRLWGLLPHNLILFGALPGLAVMSRTSPKHAAFVAVIVAALLFPAAAHTHALSAAGTTPGRLVVAVIPLLVWPIAVLIRRFWSSGLVRLATAIVTVLSLAEALTYNAHHFKSSPPLADANVSGWAMNLAFPVIRGDAWNTSWTNVALFVALAVALAALTFLAYRRAARGAAPASSLGGWALPAAVLVLIGVCSLATAANQDWTSADYLMAPSAARAEIDRGR